MIPVDQIEFRKDYGDCLRACIASIFEFPIREMPNFWEETQDAHEFWKMINAWMRWRFGVTCITVTVPEEHEYMVHDVLCIALGRQKRSDEEHAVVWKNGVVHDPHPSRMGIYNKPDTFTMFVPVKPVGAMP